MRLNFPRRSVVLASLALAVVVSVTGALVGDWVKLRELTREAVTFQDQITRQRATIEAFNRRVGELVMEVEILQSARRAKHPLGGRRSSR